LNTKQNLIETKIVKSMLTLEDEMLSIIKIDNWYEINKWSRRFRWYSSFYL